MSRARVQIPASPPKYLKTCRKSLEIAVSGMFYSYICFDLGRLLSSLFSAFLILNFSDFGSICFCSIHGSIQMSYFKTFTAS